MIRLAREADLPAVGRVYEEILDREEAQPAPYTNWQRGKYPTMDHARRALESGSLWVCEEDGVLCGSFVLNGEQLPEYSLIPWRFQAE